MIKMKSRILFLSALIIEVSAIFNDVPDIIYEDEYSEYYDENIGQRKIDRIKHFKIPLEKDWDDSIACKRATMNLKNRDSCFMRAFSDYRHLPNATAACIKFKEVHECNYNLLKDFELCRSYNAIYYKTLLSIYIAAYHYLCLERNMQSIYGRILFDSIDSDELFSSEKPTVTTVMLTRNLSMETPFSFLTLNISIESNTEPITTEPNAKNPTEVSNSTENDTLSTNTRFPYLRLKESLWTKSGFNPLKRPSPMSTEQKKVNLNTKVSTTSYNLPNDILMKGYTEPSEPEYEYLLEHQLLPESKKSWVKESNDLTLQEGRVNCGIMLVTSFNKTFERYFVDLKPTPVKNGDYLCYAIPNALQNFAEEHRCWITPVQRYAQFIKDNPECYKYWKQDYEEMKSKTDTDTVECSYASIVYVFTIFIVSMSTVVAVYTTHVW